MTYRQQLTPVFSIIVPVYNVAEYLEKCLQSIANQTFKNIEVIIVDDDSTDNSLDICEEFAKKYKNFKVYTKKNEGQGIARNYGIKQAIGEFICYVDSDDWIESELCADMYNLLTQTDADFINFGLNYVSNLGKVVKDFGKFRFDCIIGTDIFELSLLDDQILSSPCNKVYRRRFLVENDIFFPALRANEDIYYSRAISKYANKTLFVSKVYYHALVRAGSTTRKMSVTNFIATEKLLELERSEFLSCNIVDEQLENRFHAHIVKVFSYLLIQSAFYLESASEFNDCFNVAERSGFLIYSKKPKVLNFLKIKNRVMVKICLYPRILRLFVKFLKFSGLRPY